MGDEKLQKLFDDMSSIYDQNRVKDYFKHSLKLILEYIPPDSTVLDVGCGTGMYSIELAKRGYQVKGFDCSEKMIERAIRNAAREGAAVDFVVGDAEKEVPFKDKFDFAICLDCWEFFPKPVDVLNTVYQNLRQGGRLIIATPNPYAAPLIILAEKLRIKKLAPAYVYFNSFENRVRKWAKIAKFRLEKRVYSYYYLDIVFHLRK